MAQPRIRLRRLIPKSLFSRTVRALRLYCLYAQDTFPAPAALFVVLRILFIANMTFPLVLAGCAEAWSDSEHLVVILKAVSFLWRWGGLWEGKEQCLISCCVLAGLFVVAYIPNLIFAALYRHNGRISRFCCIYTSITMDVFINFLAMWSAPQLGTLIKVIYEGNYVYIVLFIVVLALYVGHIFYALTMLTPQVVYAPGRSMTWIGSDLIVMYVVMQLQSFVTRVVELIDVTEVRLALMIATFVISVLWLVFSFIASPGISQQMDIVLLMFHITNLIVFIFKALYLMGVKVNSQIVLVIYIPLVAIAYILTRFFYTRHEVSVLKTFDSLMDAENLEERLAKTFKLPLRFLDACQIAFRNAHPLLLSWTPFNWGIERWPKNSKVWMQFMRFLAIYPESKDLLLTVYDKFKLMKLRPIWRGAFVLFLHKAINSRSQGLSKELQRHLVGIENRINRIHNLMISFWTSIENSASSLTSFIANKLNASIVELETIFVHLTILYPNNYRICARYSEFLSQYEGDVIRAEAWQKKAGRIKEGTEIVVDVTSQNAFQVFPRIPKTLGPIRRMYAGIDAYSETETSQTSTSRRLFFGDSETDISPSQIRERGMSTTVSSVRNIIAVVALFFLVVYFIGSFIPTFLVMNYTNNIDGYFKGTKLISDVGFRIARVSTLLLAEALRNAKGILSTKEQMEVLTGRPDTTVIIPYKDQITEQILLVNQEVHDFDKMLGSELNLESELGRHLVSGSLWMSALTEDEKGEIRHFQYQDSIDEAWASIIGDFYLYVPAYSETEADFMKHQWFLSSVINSPNVSSATMKLTGIMCNAILGIRGDYKTSIITFMTCYLILWLFFGAWLFALLNKVQKQWIVTVKSIHTLPHKAVQDVIDKLAKDPKNLQTCDKYKNLFIQMSTSRTVSSGTTISKIHIGALFANLILSMMILCALAYAALTKSVNVITYPFKVMTTRLQNACALSAVELVMRRISLDQNVVFYRDTWEVLSELAKEALTEYKSANKQLLFGEYEGQKTGIVSDNSGLLDIFLEYDPEWVVQDRMYDRLEMMPLLSTSIVLLHTYSAFVKHAGIEGHVFSKEDEELLLLTHFLIDELSESLYYDTVLNNYNHRYEAAKSDFKTTMIVISVVGLFAGIVMISVLIYYFDTVKVAIRFSLSCMSMVESSFVRDNQHITSLFAGNFFETDFSNTSNLAIWKKVEDEIPECAIVLDEHSNIIAYNARAIALLDLEDQIVVRTKLSDVLRFDGNVPSPGAPEVELRVTLVGSNRSLEMKVSVVSCNFKNARKIMFMREENEVERTRKQIGNIEGEIVSLKYRVMPEAVRDKLDAHMMIEIHNAIFCVVDMADYDTFARGKTSDELKRRFRAFFEIVDSEVRNFNSAVKLRNLGTACFVCFNMVQRKLSFYELIHDLFGFCRHVALRCRAGSIAVRLGAAFEKSATAGMMNPNRLLFDVYASAMDVAYSMARKASPSHLLLCPRIYELVPPGEARHITHVHIDVYGQPSSAYTLSLVE